jgi:hypothetical protein
MLTGVSRWNFAAKSVQVITAGNLMAMHSRDKNSCMVRQQLDAGLIYVDRGQRRPKGWVLAHNHILHAPMDEVELHAPMDEVEQTFARMKRRSLRISVALGLAIGFTSAVIAIHLVTTIGLLMGYVRP